MVNNKKIIVGIVVFALLIAAYFVIAQQAKIVNVNVKPDDAVVKEVSCEIGVTNPRGIPLFKNGDLVIEYANCEQQFVKNCGRFGFFSDIGTLALKASGGLGSSTDVKISEGATQSYTLTWCGSRLTTDFEVKLNDENNQPLYTKKVTLQ